MSSKISLDDRIAWLDREIKQRRKDEVDVVCLESIREAVAEAVAYEGLAKELAWRLGLQDWELQQKMDRAQDAAYMLIAMGKSKRGRKK